MASRFESASLLLVAEVCGATVILFEQLTVISGVLCIDSSTIYCRVGSMVEVWLIYATLVQGL